MSNPTMHSGLLAERNDAFRARPAEPSLAYWVLLLPEPAGTVGGADATGGVAARGAASTGGAGDDRATLRLHILNLRPLRGETPFAYQARLVPPGGEPVMLPTFNTSADGTAFCTFDLTLRDIALGPGVLLALSAEPRPANPEGGEHVLEGPWIELAPPAPPQTASTARAPSAGREPVSDLFLRRDAPATPVFGPPPGYVAAPQSQEMLAPAHTLARSGGGSAVFDFDRELVTVSLEGVPTPDVFGTDPVTSRPFNVYAGWLVRRDNGDVAPLGFFRRVWAGNYRLQAHQAAPLAAFDTLLVSAEDRAGGFDPLERKVYTTSYSSFVRVPVETARDPTEV